MQYYESPKNSEIDITFKSIERFMECIDEIYEFRILGGDPFMNKEMYKVVNKLKEYTKVKKIIEKDLYEKIDFDEYVNSDLFYHEPSFVGTYQEKIKLIDKFVHLEDINIFLKKVFDIDANYILDYHVPADDLDDINAYTNKSKDRVLETYDEDIKLINFDLTSYT